MSQKNRAFGHALAWALSLGGETSDLLLVADSKYAIGEVQAKQRCLFNVRLVHFIRGVWRAIAAIRPLPAIQERATMVTHEMSSLMFRQMLSIMATGFLWLLPELAVAPHPLLPILAQRNLEPLPFHNSRRRRRFVAAKRCVASVHVLTLSPTEACRGGACVFPQGKPNWHDRLRQHRWMRLAYASADLPEGKSRMLLRTRASIQTGQRAEMAAVSGPLPP